MKDGEDSRALHYHDTPAVTFWLGLGVVALLLIHIFPGVGYAYAQALMATLALTFGIWVFWRHGDRQVTAAGVYSIASATFVGFAGLYWVDAYGSSLPKQLFSATAIAYFSHVLMYGLFWQQACQSFARVSVRPATPEVSQWAINLGLFLTVTSIIFSHVPTAGGTWLKTARVATESGMFLGVTLFSFGLIVYSAKLEFWRLLLIASAFALYVQTIFTGFGRLTLVALIMVIGVLVCARLNGRTFKVLTLAAAPVAVWTVAQIRVALVQQLHPGSPTPNLTLDALGSMVSPLETFGRLLSLRTELEFGWGETFAAAVTVYVPRFMWKDKPIGFGSELTRLLEPQLVSANHSMAALAAGEWFYNWQWLGLAAMVLVVGFAVRALDHLLLKGLSLNLDNRRRLLALAAIAIAVSGIADLVWVGSFTYSERTGFRLLALAVIFVLFAARVPSGKRPAGSLGAADPDELSSSASNSTGHVGDEDSKPARINTTT
jgi:hypothetical protein